MNRSSKLILVGLGIVLILCFVLHIFSGSGSTPLHEIFNILTGGQPAEQKWAHIVLDVRLPRAITGLLAGSALAVSGLQMQTFFRNPLAGPFVLGISSGASLGVAILIMAGSALSATFLLDTSVLGTWGTAFASMLGSFAVLAVVLVVSLRVKNSVSMLIIGLMFGSLTGALVGVLEFFSRPELIDAYLNWTFGSTGGVTWTQMQVFLPLIVIGLLLALLIQKDFNALLLGESYARSMGVNLRKVRLLTIISTSILAGGATAFCGPIAFVGLAIPHLARGLFNTASHQVLMPACILLGATLLLACDWLAELPAHFDQSVFPLNSVMTLLGAPVVIWILVHRRNLKNAF